MTIPNSLRVYSSKTGYLYVPYHEDFNFGSEDFTIEFWVKFNSWGNDRGILSKGWPAGNNGSFLVYIHNNSRMAFYASSNGSDWNIASSASISENISLNTWYHIAITRSGSTYRTFVNGIITNSWSNGASLYNNIGQGLTIGNGQTGQHPVDCLLDGLRLTKGVARYTSNFTPKTNDPAAIGLFADKSASHKPVANYGSVNISTSTSKFGGGSSYFNGSSYLSVPGSEPWKFNSDDFTVETWIKPKKVTGASSIVGNYDGSNGGWRLALVPDSTAKTSLLINASSGIVDSTGKTINNSNVSVSTTQSKFGGSSLYFDGTSGRYLSIDTNSDFGFGTGDFTVEMWIYPLDKNNWRTIFTLNEYNNGIAWRLGNNGERLYINRQDIGWCCANWNWDPYDQVNVNSWNHVALVRKDGGVTTYVNGTATFSSNYTYTALDMTSSRYVYLGASPWTNGAENFYGYMDNIRIIKGAAIYTQNFAVPTEPVVIYPSEVPNLEFRYADSAVYRTKFSSFVPDNWYHIAASKSGSNLKLFVDGNELPDSIPDNDYNNVSLLLHMKGSNGSTSFIDSSSSPKTITVYGNAQISTTQSKFGGSSGYFDGSGDYISLPQSSDWDFGSGDFTIEFWAYLLSHGGGGYNHYFSIINQNTFGFKSYSDFYYLAANGSVQVSTSAPPVLNSWQHIALVRNGTSLKIFVNGVESGSSTISPETSYGSSSGSSYVGSGWSGEYLHGYIDEFRITKGIARYASNFTPANLAFFPNTTPFTANINTSNSNGLTIGATKFSNGVVYDTYTGNIDDLRITKGVSRYNGNFSKPVAPLAAVGAAPSTPSAVSGVGLNERDGIIKVYTTNGPATDNGSPINSYGIQYSTDSGSSWTNATVDTDPYYNKVSLLLPMNGSNNSFDFYDDSQYNKNILVYNDSKITTSQSKFGGSSAVFDGNDYLVINNSAGDSSFNLKDTDWTIEAWIRPTGNWGKYNTIVGKRGAGGSDGTGADFYLYLRQSSGALSFYSDLIGGMESGATPIPNMWNHVAAVRKNNTISLYLNGVRILRFAGNANYVTNRTLCIGGWPTGDEYFYGHMNDVRITKGVARYDGEFDTLTMTQAPANRISNLTPTTPYIFRSRAQNVVGGGPYSENTTPLATLGAVTNLVAIPDDSVVYLSWTAPSVTNSAITDYSIQYSSDNGDTWNSFSHTASKSTSIIVTGLTNSTNYIFRVAAINFAGVGTYSSNSSSITVAQRLDNTYNKTRLLLHLDTNT